MRTRKTRAVETTSSYNLNLHRYQICTRCIMDTTDPEITFDSNGVCSHCKQYDQIAKQYQFNNRERERILKEIIRKIKESGKEKKYDCIIGLSGGVDSSFAAYKVKEFGLRPLAIHIDNGWNSELAVHNIKKIVKKLEIDFHACVLNWKEFKDLQLAFLKASTPDSDIPADHAIIAAIYQVARKYNVNYIISGSNYKTETHLPRAWSQGHHDWIYIKNIHKRFGAIPLKSFPHYTPYTKLYRKFFQKPKMIPILDFVNYVKRDAIKTLNESFNFTYYGGKHYESIYTRFFQGYILPVKFGYDKRKTHFSSLICSGEMTREEALKEIKKPTYPLNEQAKDKDCVIKKMGITEKEFDEIMNLPKKTYWDYPHSILFDKDKLKGLRLMVHVARRISRSL